MCLAVYVGSLAELPLVPWADRPAFHVDELKGHRDVRRKIDKPFLYDVGAHTGCACGFMKPTTPDELDSWTASMEALQAWLEGAVEAGPVEMLICWMGDESEKATRRTISVDAVRQVDFDAASDQPMRVRVHA